MPRYGRPLKVSPVRYVSQTNLSTQPGLVLAFSKIHPFKLVTILAWTPSPKTESRNPGSSGSINSVSASLFSAYKNNDKMILQKSWNKVCIPLY